MRYLSNEWKAQQWQAFEEQMIGDDTSDCGGWTWDPPCGGCARCMRMQFGYYLGIEEAQVRVLQRAGFEVSPPIVHVEYCGDYHDTWRCYSAGERLAGKYPWEK